MAEKITQAFVLGAGLGTRLRPLTEKRPKPLVPVCNRPLIEYALDHLIDAGVERFVINTHHAAGVYETVFPSGSYRGCPVELVHEPVLLETGGGIRNVAGHFGDAPFFIYNGDIFSDLPLARLVEAHFRGGAEITLAVRPSGGPLHLAVEGGRVLDIRGALNGREGNHLFTGIYIVESGFVKRIPAEPEVISVIPVWKEMIATGVPIAAEVIGEGFWHDLGTREDYLEVNQLLACGKLRPGYQKEPPERIGKGVDIAPTSVVSPDSVLGAGSSVGGKAVVEGCVLWEGARVEPGAELRNCVVLEGQSTGC